MAEPQLSVIIPCKNEEQYLPKLLKVLESQRSAPTMEYVCAISPNTSDRTASIARDFGCRVVEGGLPATARNNGARAATGRILLFMDADTYPADPWFLTKALAEFRSRNLQIAGALLLPDYNGNGFKRLLYNGLYRFVRYEFKRRQDRSNPLMQSAMFVEREIFSDLGGFKEGLFREDSELAARAVSPAHAYRFGILTECGYLMNSVRRYEKLRLPRAFLKVAYLNAKVELFGYRSIEGTIEAYFDGDGASWPAEHRKSQQR